MRLDSGNALPLTPGPALWDLYEALSPEEQVAFKGHLLGGTSAEWLAGVLREAGHKISATTIKVYRRTLARTECAS